jgi:hypothetical protein
MKTIFVFLHRDVKFYTVNQRRFFIDLVAKLLEYQGVEKRFRTGEGGIDGQVHRWFFTPLFWYSRLNIGDR